MIAQRIQHDMNISNGVHAVLNESGRLNKNAFSESVPGPLFLGSSGYAVSESSDVFKQYLQGLRYLSRKKQRRCISQELG